MQHAIKEGKAVSDKIFLKSQKILNLGCSDYLLILPQGVVSPTGNDFFIKESLENDIWKEKFIAGWDSWASVNLTYRGSWFEVKYRQLKEC